MERLILKNGRLFLIKSMLFAFTAALFAQVPSQKEQIRLLVWADLDAFPGIFEEPAADVTADTDAPESQPELPAESAQSESEKRSKTWPFDFAINRTKEIAPFLLSGMLNGWSFEYTPYDKSRKVSEYWEVKEIQPFNPETCRLEYRDPVVKEDRLLCWVYCDRSVQQIKNYEYWTSINHPHIHGKGTGKVEDGFDGIKEACSNALKQAVRDYWRTMIKNKPREISGKVLLIREPRVYIKDGQYTVDLDFFIQTDRIIEYSFF
ncbi:MAG: hypothetical protein J5780_03565 [Treponema sp.]|nr:hypothetical protein [Treponema sp.]